MRATWFQAIGIGVLVTPSQLQAIVYGFVDSNNIFTNTGNYLAPYMTLPGLN